MKHFLVSPTSNPNGYAWQAKLNQKNINEVGVKIKNNINNTWMIHAVYLTTSNENIELISLSLPLSIKSEMCADVLVWPAPTQHCFVIIQKHFRQMIQINLEQTGTVLSLS